MHLVVSHCLPLLNGANDFKRPHRPTNPPFPFGFRKSEFLFLPKKNGMKIWVKICEDIPQTSSSSSQTSWDRFGVSEWTLPRYQWIFLVPVKGGRDYIIPQKAIYKWYISGIYCQLGDYMLPTTF